MDDSCKQYIRMVKRGFNLDAVAYKMRLDGVDMAVIDLFRDSHKQATPGTLVTSRRSSSFSMLDSRSSSLLDESGAPELDKLIEVGDWEGILAAAKKWAEREETDAKAQADIWQEIAHQTRQEGEMKSSYLLMMVPPRNSLPTSKVKRSLVYHHCLKPKHTSIAPLVSSASARERGVLLLI